MPLIVFGETVYPCFQVYVDSAIVAANSDCALESWQFLATAARVLTGEVSPPRDLPVYRGDILTQARFPILTFASQDILVGQESFVALLGLTVANRGGSDTEHQQWMDRVEALVGSGAQGDPARVTAIVAAAAALGGVNYQVDTLSTIVTTLSCRYQDLPWFPPGTPQRFIPMLIDAVVREDPTGRWLSDDMVALDRRLRGRRMHPHDIAACVRRDRVRVSWTSTWPTQQPNDS
jgi:hypothetical protein